VRVTCCDGPQVADFNAFCNTDPSEHSGPARTRTLQGAHLRVGDRLWAPNRRCGPCSPLIKDTVNIVRCHSMRAPTSDLFAMQRTVVALLTDRADSQLQHEFTPALQAIRVRRPLRARRLQYFSCAQAMTPTSAVLSGAGRTAGRLRRAHRRDGYNRGYFSLSVSCNGLTTKGLQVQVFDQPCAFDSTGGSAGTADKHC